MVVLLAAVVLVTPSAVVVVVEDDFGAVVVGAVVGGALAGGTVAGGAVAGGAVAGGEVGGGAARKEIAVVVSCERSSAWPDTALVLMPQATWRQSVAPKRPTTERRVAKLPDPSVVTFWRPTELQVWSSAEEARHSITNRAMPGRKPLPRTTTI
ncbi:MAG: hypothetical protein R2746_17730 [Acidimicrobiales bacterium]